MDKSVFMYCVDEARLRNMKELNIHCYFSIPGIAFSLTLPGMNFSCVEQPLPLNFNLLHFEMRLLRDHLFEFHSICD